MVWPIAPRAVAHPDHRRLVVRPDEDALRRRALQLLFHRLARLGRGLGQLVAHCEELVDGRRARPIDDIEAGTLVRAVVLILTSLSLGNDWEVGHDPYSEFTPMNGVWGVGVCTTHYPKSQGDCPPSYWTDYPGWQGGTRGATAISLVEIDDDSAVVNWPACAGAGTLGQFSFWSPAVVTGMAGSRARTALLATTRGSLQW